MEKIKVAAVMYEKFEILDFYGPIQIFGMLEEYFEIYTLAETQGPIPSSASVPGYAQYSLNEDRQYDLILLPGGIGSRKHVENSPIIAWLLQQDEKARFVTSVCTGAGILAAAGLLENRRATTNKASFAWPKSLGHNIQWIEQARWVEDGKYFTSAGVSAGIDMALGLVAKILGRDIALTTAKYAEYSWHEDANWDPFAAQFGLLKA